MKFMNSYFRSILNMKIKTIASAVLLASAVTSASAYDVFEKDGLTYSIGGELELQLITESGADAKVQYDDSVVSNTLSYKVSDALTLTGAYDFGDETGSIAADFGSFTASIGDLDLATDDFGSDASWVGASMSSLFPEVATNAIGLSTSFGSVDVAVVTEVEGDQSDILLGTSFGPVGVQLGYETESETTGLGLSTTVGDFGLGLDFSTNDDDEVVHLSGTYGMFGLGYETSDDVDSWYKRN